MFSRTSPDTKQIITDFISLIRLRSLAGCSPSTALGAVFLREKKSNENKNSSVCVAGVMPETTPRFMALCSVFVVELRHISIGALDPCMPSWREQQQALNEVDWAV